MTMAAPPGPPEAGVATALVDGADDVLGRGPRGLRVQAFAVDDEEFVVFDFALPPALLPASLARRLTRTESDVALLLIEGASNDQIAARRGRSRHTVVNQVASVFRKLGVVSRSELQNLCAAEDEGAPQQPARPDEAEGPRERGGRRERR
jgi:DNA-binding CsgD family transcriptional regulator